MKFNGLNQQCLLPPRLWDKQLRNNLSGWTETWPFQNCHQDEDPRYLVSQFPMEEAAPKLRDSHGGFCSPLTVIPHLFTIPGVLSHQPHVRKISKRKFPNHRNHNLLGDHYHFTVFHSLEASRYSCPTCERKEWQGHEDKGQGSGSPLQLWRPNSPSLTLYHFLPHRADSFCPEPSFLSTASLCVHTKVINSSMW